MRCCDETHYPQRPWSAHRARVGFDLRGLRHCSSIAAHALLQLPCQARGEGHPIVVVGQAPVFRRNNVTTEPCLFCGIALSWQWSARLGAFRADPRDGLPHMCDSSPDIRECSCGVVVTSMRDRRYDFATGKPHRHRRPAPIPVHQILPALLQPQGEARRGREP